MGNDDLKRKIGQMMMVGISSTSLTVTERELLRRLNVGGVILFKRNYRNLEQLVDLVNDLNSTLDRPFIGVDQEGGEVLRLGEPFTQFPSGDYLGAYYQKMNSLDLIRSWANALAAELKAAGINLCFVPVLDILTNPNNKVIGRRAFSSKRDVVTELGAVFVEEFDKVGMMSCPKHFPGHGDTVIDSHLDLPVVDYDLEFLKKREIVPFARACKLNAPFIMTAHILYTKIDPDNPATLSSTMIDDLLRRELDYKNIVVTDDLDMNAVKNKYSLPLAASAALEAGADISLICHSFGEIENVFEALRQKADEEKFASCLLQSIARIEGIKNKYIRDVKIVDFKEASKSIGTEEAARLCENVLSQA